MYKVDVVILYEHRARDFENACFLAAKLEYLGFTTKIYNIYESCKNKIKSKVILVPHLYNNEQLYSFCKQKNTICPCIIDMQYEQVLSLASLDGIHNPSGQAVNAYHLSWGKSQTERYIKCGIAADKIVESGHVGMDLLRPRYLNYFYNRDYLAEEFNLDKNKSWVMFLSSFSYANLSESTLRSYEMMFSEARRLAKISDMSLKEIICWFDKFTKDNPDKILIYRPHPAESVVKALYELQDKRENFRIISKYSIRQWMNPINVFLNWYSTSVIDTYFANKRCYTLRPCDIPQDLEVEILVGSRFVHTYDELLAAIKEKQYSFPVKPEIIEYYYGKRDKKEASDTIIELVQDLINNRLSGHKFDIEELKKNITHYGFIKKTINSFVLFLAVRYDLTILNFLIKRKSKDFNEYKKEIYGYRKDVKSFKLKFLKILN